MPDETAAAEWVRAHTTPLETLDPDRPLDDLEPLRDIVGNARVVALGEGAHFVREFTDARARLTRFLVERCGFTAVAYEFSFPGGYAVDRWVQGAGAEDDLAAISPAAVTWGGGEFLRSLRRHHRHSDPPVRFVGIDTPEAGGTLLPALGPVRDYLADVDPDALPQVDTAIALAERVAGGSALAAARAWAALGTGEQDALTATLARLRLRLDGLEPRYVAAGDQRAVDTAGRHLETAIHTDHAIAATAGMLGLAAPAEPLVRDRFMADTVGWHLDHGGPGTKIVLVAHNNHIQKTPVVIDGAPPGLVMGEHLSRALGADYVAVAMTHTADAVPEMALDDRAAVGFTVERRPLAPPEVDSIEAAVGATGSTEAAPDGIEAGPVLVDLRGGHSGLRRIRTQSTSVRAPLGEAFDAAVVVSTATTESTVDL